MNESGRNQPMPIKHDERFDTLPFLCNFYMHIILLGGTHICIIVNF